MPSIYLTPAAILLLTQLLLSLAISAYILRSYRKLENRNLQTLLLGGFFLCSSGFLFLLFLQEVLLSRLGLAAGDLEHVLLAGGLVFFLQFAYRFPEQQTRRVREAGWALAISTLYIFLEIAYSLYSISRLQSGLVVARPTWMSIPLAVGLAWSCGVFLRQSVQASIQASIQASFQAYIQPSVQSSMPAGERPGLSARIRLAWHPKGRPANACRTLASMSGLFLLLSLAEILQGLFQLTPVEIQAGLCAGILLANSAVILVYFHSLPEANSLVGKLVGTTLVISLGVLGAAGWAIAPAYAETFTPGLPQQQNLRFTPNMLGGYDVSELPFDFSQDWGNRLGIQHGDGPEGSQPIDFMFQFFGRSYAQVTVGNDGVVGMGARVETRNLLDGYGATPAIFPFLMDLAPETGGVYANQGGDNLLLTWESSNYYHPEQRYAFQIRLQSDGVFELSYADLPGKINYHANDAALANLWLIGAVPGSQANPVQLVDFFPSSGPIQGGPNGFVQDGYLEFRDYLQRILLPLVVLILADCLLVGLGLPLLIHLNLVRPLKNLLAGVKKVEKGDLEVEMPVRFLDEIGSLTASFNNMTRRLREQVSDLESHVARRTQELQTTNARLQTEISQRESAQQELVAQESQLAIAEEQERMGRDLHDGLGQVMGYLNTETQAVQDLLEQGQTQAAKDGLQRVAGVAQDAQARIRNFILGLRSPQAQAGNLFSTLETSLKELGQDLGLQTLLSIPEEAPNPLFAAAVETQAAYIIGEALNNVRQHARAKRVELVFSLAGEMAQILISDDGVGFAPGEVQVDGHSGLHLIRERAGMAGGRLELRSAPGSGCQVLAFLPRLMSASERSPQADALHLQNLRVLLADGSPLFLEGLRTLLLGRGVQVVGLARDGLQACEKADQLQPEVVIMELEMPGLNGLEATQRIKAENPGIKVVILSDSEREADLFEAIRSGASGYLLKSMDGEAFCHQLAGLRRGESPLPPGLSARLVREFSRSSGKENEPGGKRAGAKAATEAD